jgi:hypothetical protein
MIIEPARRHGAEGEKQKKKKTVQETLVSWAWYWCRPSSLFVVRSLWLLSPLPPAQSASKSSQRWWWRHHPCPPQSQPSSLSSIHPRSTPRVVAREAGGRWCASSSVLSPCRHRSLSLLVRCPVVVIVVL